MLWESIEFGTKKVIRKEYPHIKLPQCVLAEIIKGGTIITLQILNEDESRNELFAPIPNIPTKESWKTGEIVIITFLYGKIELPIILRKWESFH